MEDIKNILVGVDFSTCSLAGLAHALRIAQWNRATVFVDHYIEPLPITDYTDFTRVPVDQFLTEMQQAALAKLKDIVATAQRDGQPITGAQVEPVETHVHVQSGPVLLTLLDRVKETAADLLILGAHGTHHRGKRTGTLASKAVRKAPTRVLLVREDHRGPFRKVVCCVDFSPTARRALVEAIRTASQDDASLVVLHVTMPPWEFPTYALPEHLAAPEYRQAHQKVFTQELEEFLAPVRAELETLHAESRVVENANIAGAIVDFLQTTGAELAVLGTRGRSGWKKLFLGTTAERIIHDSPCSTLTIKPEGYSFEV